jgi:Phasin protein
MDGEWPGKSGFVPLVPPPRMEGPAALLEMQQRGIEMVMAANRLALSWLQQAAHHHADLTRRTLDEMADTARRMAITEAPPEKAQAALEAVDRAQALGLETAKEITALMQRMQGDTVALLGTVLRGGRG